MRSVAGQVLLLQLTIVVLLVVVAVVTVVLQARRDSRRDARHRSAAAAEAFANAPGTADALLGPNAAALLQPRVYAARVATGVDFMVVVDNDGASYGSTSLDVNPDVQPPDPRIREFAQSGRSQTYTYSAPGGPVVLTAVPVRDAAGHGVGLVASAVTVSRVRSTADEELPLVLGSGAAALLLAGGGTAVVSRRLRRQTGGLGPAEMTRMYEHHDAVLHAVREGVLITRDDGRLMLVNDEARRLLDLPPDAEGRDVGDLGLEPDWAALLASERSVTDEVRLSGEHLLAVNKRLTHPGGDSGSVVTLRDTTELRKLAGHAESTRRRLRLLYEAGMRIGTTLDVVRTARELAEVATPGFADHVSVDLLDQVLRGDEPSGTVSRLRRVASHGVHDGSVYPMNHQIVLDPTSPEALGVVRGDTVLVPDLTAALGWRAQDPRHAARLLDNGLHSLIGVPLRARGVVLGVASFWRGRTPGAFDEEDAAFAEELSARAAVSVDNARRFTREHTMAAALQRSLLPRGLPEQDTLDVAYRYLPAEAGVGGDWFDVIPLSGARVALVVGDVVGHGLHAAATMGRLRTAVHNFAALDLAPDELLTHLDDLVTRIDQDTTDTDTTTGTDAGGPGPVTGATCLYAIYDPTTGTLTAARAGHPGPLLLHPDGHTTTPDIPVTPPLGLAAGLPVETTELTLPEHTRVILFTDGLIEDRHHDIDTGLHNLRTALEHAPPHADPERLCAHVVDTLAPQGPPADDIALLVARTRRLGTGQVATWDVPADPAAVAPVRAACARQLHAWGLDDAGFATELIMSELVTNAVRHGTEPIQVRLLRGHTLICEVSDAGSTSPHLRHATPTDEGGRGLLLVARYAQRWGTRYLPRGKVIWAEQPLHGPAHDTDDIDTDALLDQWDDL
ncbi:SpoIIE family protein phosphatase [Yinghuangia sp. ASG 101]|nr:SpoIIE family protein phosphatase [Yinghuangia sp. ASG 101]UGQ12806.1 SpoIIE family protein phosphatase [Yinghuangia sp. ASG 101]